MPDPESDVAPAPSTGKPAAEPAGKRAGKPAAEPTGKAVGESVEGSADPGRPVVRPATARFVRLSRAAVVVVLGYGVTMAVLAVTDLHPTVWLWVAVAVGGSVHLAGVAGVWVGARSPSWRRPGGHGGPPERSRARKALLSGADLDPDRRRLVAEEVAATTRTPYLVSWMAALLGPSVLGAPNTSTPLPWAGAVVAGGMLALLGFGVSQLVRYRRLCRSARRIDALPVVEGGDVRYPTGREITRAGR